MIVDAEFGRKSNKVVKIFYLPELISLVEIVNKNVLIRMDQILTFNSLAICPPCPFKNVREESFFII